MRTTTTTTIIGVTMALAILMSSCGSGNTPESEPMPPTPSHTSEESSTSAPSTTSSETETSPSPDPDRPVVEVTISGSRVDAPGDRVKTTVGEPVTFAVTSDRAGELHVHSSPEQTPSFDVGTSDVEVIIERPGLIEVEEHESGELIAQLEVR